jgi:Brp/Blh family beta-carotene 15,15'-monooxygenase
MTKSTIHTCILLLIVLTLLFTRQYWTKGAIEYSIATLGILFAGIPHGALDHITASYIEGKKFRLSHYLFRYSLSAILYLVVWLLFPGVALLLFILLTAWHFGETDLICFTSKKIPAFMIFIYGFCLLMWLLMKDTGITLQWIRTIAGKQEYVEVIVNGLSAVPLLLWFIFSAIIILAGAASDKTKWPGTGVFLCFLFTAVYTSLILGFILYFTAWHSMQALQHIRFSVFRDTGLKKLLLYMLPATLGSFLIFLIIVNYGKEEWLQSSSLPSLFILLSVLTLPHMAQMHKLYTVIFTDAGKNKSV